MHENEMYNLIIVILRNKAILRVYNLFYEFDIKKSANQPKEILKLNKNINKFVLFDRLKVEPTGLCKFGSVYRYCRWYACCGGKCSG